MQIVLIDTFVVPESSKSALIEKAKQSASFLRTIPGFVEGYIFDKIDGDGSHNVVTTAVWENQAAFEAAKKTAATEFQRIGFNPQEVMRQLNVTVQRAIYKRSPY